MVMKRKLVLSVLFLLFSAVAVFSGYKIVSILLEYRAGENTYSEVQQYVHLPEEDKVMDEEKVRPVVTAAPEEPEIMEDPVVFPEVDFEALLEVNSDVVGWVYIEDTAINYPVVQGVDNRRYLSTMIDGTYNNAGSIFMDYRNQPDMSDPHTVLYGHNMKNQTMFEDITNYVDQAFYDAHPVGMFMTPDKNYQFEVVAGYVANVADPAWQLEFFSDEDRMQWLEDAMARSAFSSNTIPELGDRILTLSTCSYEYNNARFVLVGILKEY